MGFGAGLGWKGEGDPLTAGLSNYNLLLFNSVGGISKLGNIEALVLNLVFTLHLCDFNSFGDTHFLGSRVGQLAGNLKRSSDKGDLVSLGLVLLTADLMLSLSISISMRLAVSRRSTRSHFHGFGFFIISDLCGCARGYHILSLILIGADFPLHNSGGLFTDGEDTVEAVVIVNNLLDCKSDRGHLLSKGRDTDLSIDR